MTTRDVVVHLCGLSAGPRPAMFAECTRAGCVVLRVPGGERVRRGECANGAGVMTRASGDQVLTTGGTLYGVTLTPEVLAAVRAMCPIDPWARSRPPADAPEQFRAGDEPLPEGARVEGLTPVAPVYVLDECARVVAEDGTVSYRRIVSSYPPVNMTVRFAPEPLDMETD